MKKSSLAIAIALLSPALTADDGLEFHEDYYLGFSQGAYYGLMLAGVDYDVAWCMKSELAFEGAARRRWAPVASSRRRSNKCSSIVARSIRHGRQNDLVPKISLAVLVWSHNTALGEFMSEKNIGVVAGNGLLDRRFFLQAGVAGGATLLTAQASGLEREEWMKFPGGPMSDNGAPSAHESHVKRIAIASQPGTTGTGVSRTPLEYLNGLITPSRLHFERSLRSRCNRVVVLSTDWSRPASGAACLCLYYWTRPVCGAVRNGS
jgi:hypothetical protein